MRVVVVVVAAGCCRHRPRPAQQAQRVREDDEARTHISKDGSPQAEVACGRGRQHRHLRGR